MEIRLLGPLEVRDGERTVALPRRQQRALLAALALRAGEVVSTDRLVADLWGERAPASATGSLQNTVSALRKALGRDVLVTQPPGYRLAIDPERVDANRFERLLDETRNAEPARRAALLTEALDLWHGSALADLDEEQFARLEAARLDELRVVALEERIDAELELGRHGPLVGELEALVAAHPLRERLRGQLMVAFYRCGRQAEALEVYRAARLALADELGLDPSPELQELERRVLRQDPSLAAPAEAAGEVVPATAERRLVSVLVAVPPAEDDPELLRARLDDVLASARDILARHGGELERFGPEGLVVVFGAESPRDDDALSAVRAAAELGLPAGVATGESVGGAGAVFVRAADLAHGSGVQVDERTRALVQHERRFDAPLVGRTEELSRLRAAFDKSRADGCCRVVSVIGEPGIGKTRLGRELVAALDGEAVALVGHCVSYGGGSTFLPLLDALRELDIAATMAPEPDGHLAVQRLAALGGAPDAGTIGESYWAVRRLLETLARERPVVLLLDDVHWAEPALLDLVDYLAERVEMPLLVLCLARPELERVLGEPLRLGPLTPEEANAVVRGAAEVDERTRARIVELAEGNALYAEQLAVYAAEAGEGLPPTLEAVLAGRLGQLDDRERAVLQRAAVVGREFTRGALAALADTPIDPQLASLGRRGLIRVAADIEPGDDAYSFHHVLLLDAAYASLTKRARATLHERTGAWLDRDGPGDDALVGYHLEQAVLLRRGTSEATDDLAHRAGERLAQAGMWAWRQSDAHAAADLFRRAAAFLAPGDRRSEILCELSIAERLLADPYAGDAALAAADEDAVGGPMRHRVALERALAGIARGDVTPAELARVAHVAREVFAAAGDERALGRAWFAVFETEAYTCRYPEQLAAARTALHHYRNAQFSTSLGFYALSSALLWGPTPVGEAVHECRALLAEASDRRAEANVIAALAGLAAMEGRIDDAYDLIDLSRETFAELGDELGGSWCELFVHRRAGNLEAVVDVARACTELLADGDPAHTSSYLCQEAEALLALGRYAEAVDAAAQALESAVEYDVYVQAMLRSAHSRLAAREHRQAESERLAAEAVAMIEVGAPTVRADVLMAFAEVSASGGRHRQAWVALEEAEALLRAKGDLRGAEAVAAAAKRRGPVSEAPR